MCIRDRGYFELGFAYLSTDRNAQEEAFRKGKDYALESLRLDPKFVKTEQESFRAAISGATDVAALFWYGNNLGSYLNFHFMAALSGGMNDVRAAFARAIELGPDFLENYVDAAEYVYKQGGEWDEFCANLREAITRGKDPKVMATWPLYNALALKRAESLIDDKECQ